MEKPPGLIEGFSENLELLAFSLGRIRTSRLVFGIRIGFQDTMVSLVLDRSKVGALEAIAKEWELFLQGLVHHLPI
jgi:hypothetical protein